jgi:hypothetical protein
MRLGTIDLRLVDEDRRVAHHRCSLAHTVRVAEVALGQSDPNVAEAFGGAADLLQ